MYTTLSVTLGLVCRDLTVVCEAHRPDNCVSCDAWHVVYGTIIMTGRCTLMVMDCYEMHLNRI